MQSTLERFLQALRTAEVRISPAEAIEAFETASLVGYEDRGVFRDSLALVLAKSEPEKRIFADVFDRFFDREIADADALTPGAIEPPAPDDGAAGELIRMLAEGDVNALAAAMEAAGNRVGVSGMRFFSQRGFFARRMLDAMGLAEFEAEIARLNRVGEPAASARAAALDRGRDFLLEQARDFVERQYALFAAPAAGQLREEFLQEMKLANIDQRDFARLNAIVRRLAKRLASRHARRRRSARRGQLDLRRMVRQNAAYDGVPVKTVWKSRRIDRPRVIAIVDVSRSVASAARFLLLLLYNLHDVIADIRGFAFSDRLIEVSDILERESVEDAMVEILRQVGFRPTDYGRAFSDFAAAWPDAVDRRTTVIVMGDGRSNRTDPRPDLLQTVHRRAKRVIWLNPEPRSFWGTGDSEMPRYLPYCTTARTCNTLRHLERVVDDLLRAYAPGV